MCVFSGFDTSVDGLEPSTDKHPFGHIWYTIFVLYINHCTPSVFSSEARQR
jgi:hypothetical protein